MTPDDAAQCPMSRGDEFILAKAPKFTLESLICKYGTQVPGVSPYRT